MNSLPVSAWVASAGTWSIGRLCPSEYPWSQNSTSIKDFTWETASSYNFFVSNQRKIPGISRYVECAGGGLPWWGWRTLSILPDKVVHAQPKKLAQRNRWRLKPNLLRASGRGKRTYKQWRNGGRRTPIHAFDQLELFSGQTVWLR